MKKIQALFMLVAVLLMAFSASLRAEDTDIYVSNGSGDEVPNILFVIDTAASFSSNADACTYASGGSPSLGNTAGGIEQCALVDAIESLPNGVVNMGIMITNDGTVTDTRLTSDPAYHETCVGNDGGCLVRKLTLMDAAAKASLVNFIKSWTNAGQNSATALNVKSNNTRTGGMMQEAWAYYHGKLGMSGKNYGTSIVAGCQKNFVIFIGNAFGNNGAPGDPVGSSPYDGTNAMTSAQVNATAAQKIKISETVTFSPASCKDNGNLATSFPPGTGNNWSENWADEWARLMFQQDGGTNTQEGVQNIISYTVGVVDPNNNCKPDYPALMTTMAKYGGGKYFRGGNASEVTTALAQILNEVQAVNSVFSSASLPVSVNAEGSYLNQIYLGMFRPDATGSPRWLGNLKQYQMIKVGSSLVLGDNSSPPKAALSAAGTGFLSPNAVSFWTKKDTSKAPDDATTGGFYKNDLKGEPLSAYDWPDGEVVEKGGVAQQLRLESLKATFSGAGSTADTTNPRRLYTYCPGGGTCTAALTHADNAFTTGNATIASAAFGSATTVPIASIVRSGTSALVTTNGNHGFGTTATVTISNVNQSEYNVTQDVTINSPTTFTITGLPDFPTTPAAGAYTVSSAATAPVSITSLSRSSSTSGGNNAETVTVVTSAPHGFTTTSTIAISGASPSTYNFTGTPSAVGTSSFTFSVAVEPHTPALNTYKAQLNPSAYPALTNVSLTNPGTGLIYGTKSGHKLHAGQTVTISNGSANKYNGTFTIATVDAAGNTFTITNAGNDVKNLSAGTGTVTPNTALYTISSLTRAASTAAATATAVVSTSNVFGAAAGDTKSVKIGKTSGTQTNEGAYAIDVTITCANTGCTTFTYPITVTPSESATGTMTVRLAGAATVNLSAGAITRVGTTATVTGIPAGTFANGQTLTLAASGTSLSSEAAYIGDWAITCSGLCTEFTFGPVTQTPTTPATGVNMQVYSGSSPPDKDTIIKWVRGHDNFGDEKGPGSGVTVRPSVHGDVLHSRPLVINYGADNVVVFYGSNDGVFRAVNGNQTAAIGSIPAGGEMWGLVLPEHFGELNRQRLASPELKFPSTLLASAQPKDYFVDGPTGTYQKLNSTTGAVETAYIYLTMRRGGKVMYGLNVSNKLEPTVAFKIDTTKTGFSELGQTWSRPRLTLLEKDSAAAEPTPVLVFGAGYDPAQDNEPPTGDSMGRGIYVINATTGALIWSATKTCVTSSTCLNVPGMNFAIPSEIAMVDRNGNGFTDKLYFGDLGGNLWRADIAGDTSAWTVTKVAALGCDDDDGVCASGVSPRKFFFPPAVLTVGSGASAFESISLASGDREHPLRSASATSSHFVPNKFFMIKDLGTTVGGTATTGVIPGDLFNANSLPYGEAANVSNPKGFYISFTTGEKAVNAPLALNGFIFFATNRPTSADSTCKANLGEAKAYAVSPFFGTRTSNIFAGGGLPPSPVAGLITIGTETEGFCIGCGISDLPPDPMAGGEQSADGGTNSECDSALGVCKPKATISKNMSRTYWYKK